MIQSKKRNTFNTEVVERFLNDQPFRACTAKKLHDTIHLNLPTWNFKKSLKASKVIDLLLDQKKLQLHVFSNETTQKVVYTWNTGELFTVVSGLKSGGYFSFYTALHLHQLSLQIPKTIYLNFEHAKPLTEEPFINQEQIDKAFSKPQRKSNNSFFFNDRRIILTNSRYTNRLGVIKEESADRLYCYTDLERTLIDIVARPVYSGGVFEVLEAYRTAREKVDVKRLLSYLKKMDFVYPYNQCIGFYLERAGYEEKSIALFKGKMEYDFYLTYNMNNPEYSKKWKLYFPKGM